jgi:nitroreductase
MLNISKRLLTVGCLGTLFCAFDICKGNDMKYIEGRIPGYNVTPLIINRWSPRSFSGCEITDEQLMTLFEAARWAPSSYNNQSWRFVYVKRNSSEWQNFLNVLVPFNREWAQHAAALVVVVSKNTFDFNGKQSRTHSFDTGAAWENFALQAVSMGLITHGMEGFDYDAAARLIKLPEGYSIEIITAVGYQASADKLSEYMKDKEHPADRKPLSELVFENSFIS